jgi:hypothetical protein
MLRDIDKELIERESHRFDTKNEKHWLKPLIDCDIVKSLEDLLENYNIHEFTTHWYDSSPKFDNISCDLCKRDISCSKCKIWKEWNFSKEQLSFNNWIDVEGPGIWDDTQETANKRIEEIFNEILYDKEFKIRAYYYQPPEDKYFHIFYYNRDREHFDYWFVFKRKAGAGPSSKKN